MAEHVQVEGLKAVTRDLKKLDADFPKKLKLVGKESADIVAQAAKPLAPVLTGKLRNSIKPGATAKGAYVQAGKNSLPYGGVIHFGWARHHIAPQPFVYQALDARRDEVIERYEKGVNDLIDKTMHDGVKE